MRRATLAWMGAAALLLGLGIRLAWRPPPPQPAASAGREQPAPSRSPAPVALEHEPRAVAAAASPQAEPSDPARRVRVFSEPDAAFVQESLRAALDAHLPRLKLSSEEIEQAADALLRIRAAQQELRSLPPTPENAERLHALRESLGRAVDDFSYVMEMSPAEFTRQVQPDTGIDASGDEAIPDGGAGPADAPLDAPPVYLKDLPGRE